MSPHRVISKKIGELLIERNVITPDQLSIALEWQRKNGGYISQHLIALDFATEFDIANCLASQYGFAYLPLDSYNVPLDLLDLIPLKLIKIYMILPVDKVGNVFTVTMADPLNDGVIEMLKQITKCEIEVFISTYSELKIAIEKYYGKRLAQMNKQSERETEALKEKFLEQFIQTTPYKGRERRRIGRLHVDLDAEFSLQGKIFKARIKNISHVGVFFLCDFPIALDTNVVFRIKDGDIAIDAIIQIIRMEKMNMVQQQDLGDINAWVYGIAGFFNFISEEDKNKLAVFLNEIQDRQKKSR